MQFSQIESECITIALCWSYPPLSLFSLLARARIPQHIGCILHNFKRFKKIPKNGNAATRYQMRTCSKTASLVSCPRSHRKVLSKPKVYASDSPPNCPNVSSSLRKLHKSQRFAHKHFWKQTIMSALLFTTELR